LKIFICFPVILIALTLRLQMLQVSRALVLEGAESRQEA
jgi:hypothetical protein